MSDKISQSQVLLVIPLAGVVALVAFEMIRALSAAEADLSGLPPVAMLASLLSLSALAPILLTFAKSVCRWIALVIAGLMTLFHSMHVVEHLVIPDLPMVGLIGITMLLPSLIATLYLWRDKSSWA
ncbi:MAG: hypothetical protein AAF431_18880 [Pseudomonadota bacterium]